MGIYVEADCVKDALKKARKKIFKKFVVTSAGRTRHKGLYYVHTKKRRGY